MDYSMKQVVPDKQKDKPVVEPKAPEAPTVVGGDSFPDRDTFQGEKVDGSYATAKFEKENIVGNLKKVGEEIKTRFGLEDRGV